MKRQNPEQQAEAMARTLRALAHIQQAQAHLNLACAELSSLTGAIPEWSKAGKLADQVKAFWYRVSEKRDRYKLDGIASETLAGAKRDAP